MKALYHNDTKYALTIYPGCRDVYKKCKVNFTYGSIYSILYTRVEMSTLCLNKSYAKCNFVWVY